jgi:hypothetical protein
MTCIGLSIARDSDLDIVTADGKYHEALATTDEEDNFDTLLRQRKLQKLAADSEARRDLGQLVIAVARINLKALARTESRDSGHRESSTRIEEVCYLPRIYQELQSRLWDQKRQRRH